ncbi:hypothetical protein, partial [Jatrophihabitans sp.]|uniref:hypothetical protein n=1 Tax=Jatrophihabitans sp. TaxID=1932789 RepID=UPI0030C6B82B|nr:hypothetical protein [Jatrophihabitans sp.]
AAAYAADAAAAAYARGQTGARLSLAHRACDLFDELTRHVRVEVSEEQIAQAYACMVTTH